MNEITPFFDNPIFILVLILQIIVLFVFFRMAANISNIKSSLLNTNIEELFVQAEMLKFVGNKKEAVLKYKEYVFYVKRSALHEGDKTMLINKAEECIKALS